MTDSSPQSPENLPLDETALERKRIAGSYLLYIADNRANPIQKRQYVRLAFQYGYSVEDILDLSGLTLARVEELLAD